MFNAMLFGHCCCTNDKDGAEVKLEPAAGGDGAVRPATPAFVPISSRPVHQEEALDRDRSPEEEVIEKARLQKAVNAFMKKAVRGVPCTHITEDGERLRSSYKIPKSLETITLKGAGEATDMQHVIVDIQDVYCTKEDGQTCFNPIVLAAVPEEERDRLLMVVMKDGQKFCFLEDSTESRDSFLECLRILCIYAQASKQAVEQTQS